MIYIDEKNRLGTATDYLLSTFDAATAKGLSGMVDRQMARLMVLWPSVQV